MKPYDPKAKCPKCDHDDVSTRYHDQWRYSHDPCYVDEIKKEHLDRTCGRCHFGWYEACIPVDAGRQADLAGIPASGTIT